MMTLLVSDGVTARIGALTSGREWFKPWRTITGEELAASTLTELQVMLQGVFDPRRFLALLRDFIVFEDDGGGKIVKKVAGYHQYHAVRVAVSETLRAGISSGKANPSPGVLEEAARGPLPAVNGRGAGHARRGEGARLAKGRAEREGS